MNTKDDALPRRRSRTLRVSMAIFAVLMFAGFFALGTWQIFRLQWKLALIDRVEQRVHAAAVEAPRASEWPQVGAETHEYRHVRLRGVYLPKLATRVLASTDRGAGYWLLTPMCTSDGIVMVNRGFLPTGEGGWKAEPMPPVADGAAQCPAALAAAASASAGGAQTTVTGLLRLSEKSGSVLRKNDAQRNFWYSRELSAIAQARGLPAVAPFFVDVEANGEAPVVAGEAQAPVGGMTVISFPNNHLVYAITWFGLALMVAGAAFWVVRHERKG
jgi:surfeit locus 1 family protein